MAIKNVGVIGCGLMGSGIVQVAAQAGFSVLFVEANDELVKKGLGRLRDTLEGLAARGKLEAKAKDEILARIAGTPRFEDLKGCDLVVEAMTENQALKNETFAKLDRICPPHTLLATNTSSCNVTAMAAATKRPARSWGCTSSTRCR
jgi:3-hydroxybutyryl-CoA dehydrogenase